MFVSTAVPHGDFLLHMGYMQNGTKNVIGIPEEPYPGTLELPEECKEFKGYRDRSTRGGHYFFLVLGQFKIFLALIRMIILLIFVFSLSGADYRFNALHRVLPQPLSFVYALCSYTLFLLAMTIMFIRKNPFIHIVLEFLERLCCATFCPCFSFRYYY